MRVPASFCGLYGIRPTHGRLDLTGMLPQAPSSDTTGWFARDAETFARVSAVLLGEPIPTALPTRLVVAVDAFGFADAETRRRAPADGAHAWRRWSATCARTSWRRRGCRVWARAQRTLQPYEAWLTFKDWIDRDNPRMAFSVARNLALGEHDPRERAAWAALMRAEARARLALAAAAGHDPLPADDAVPGAAARACRSRRSSRCATASPACPRTAAWPACRR